MNATPDKREGEVERKPRREKYVADVLLPDCDAQYIVEYLSELGVAVGEHALTFVEIESWQRQSGIELQPWEVRFVKRLSAAYIGESHAARAPDAAPPWADAPYLQIAPAPASSSGLMAYLAEMKQCASAA